MAGDDRWRERAEHAEGLLARAMENAVTGVLIMGLDGTVAHVNAPLARMYGYEVDEIIGTRVLDVIHPDDHAFVTEKSRQLVRGEIDSYIVEHRGLHKGGSIIWLRSHIAVVRDADGRPTHTSAQVENYTELRETRAALDAERARFVALLEHSSDVIALVDANAGVLYASPALERISVGPEISFTNTEPFDRVHADDRGRVQRTWHELLLAPGSTRSFDTRLQGGDEVWRHFEVVATNRLDDGSVAGVVLNLRDVSERVAAYESLQWQAFHDPLTGLANRALFFNRLEQGLGRAKRTGRPVALLYIDLDGFKVVNDRLGHRVGDDLLVSVAERLVGAVRGDDTVARIGGDEFIVLAENVADAVEAATIAEHVIDVVGAPVGLAGVDVVVTASVGIAVGADDPDSLIQRADAALYRAKSAGKCRVEVDVPDR